MATACPEGLGFFLEEFEGKASAICNLSDPDVERLESTLLFGCSLALMIDYVDHRWRMETLSGKEPYDVNQESAIQSYYRDWLRGAGGILVSLDRAESRGHSVKNSDLFRRCYRENQSALTPDSEFFAGDALVRLRDDAIDAHREGRTVELHEIGD